MKKVFFKITIYTLLLFTIVFSFLVFLPRNYHVPQLEKRPGTQYWDLPTGSGIGYTHIEAKGIKKPFPIIFLQGGPGGPIYDSNIAMLAPLSNEGYDIYLYDQVGCGHSERLENINEYTADRHKKDLEEIIKIIGAKKVILIGQSWGAILATLFIADNPQKVEKAILTSPGPIQPQNKKLSAITPPDSLHLKKPLFTNAGANKKANNIRTRLTALFANIFGIKLASDKEADDFQTYLTNETNKSIVCDLTYAPLAKPGGGYYVQIKTLQSLSEIKNPRQLLKEVEFPVLIMKGQCDNLHWGYTNEYLELFQNHQLIVIKDAGHSISVEQPESYLQTIQKFLLL